MPRLMSRELLRRLRRTARGVFVRPLRRLRARALITAMVTGSNGKTTTVRMLGRILEAAGHRVGTCTTDGVVVAGREVRRGDSAGYHGAETVFADRSLTAAVLETARGDLIARGSYLDRVDAAALLNVGREHVGMDGIDSPEAMMSVKRRVTDAARRAVVLNADDRLTARLAASYPPQRVVVFSFDAGNPVVRNAVAAGGRAVCLVEDRIVLTGSDGAQETLVSVADMPSAFGGILRHNVANAMAAAGMAVGLGLPRDSIAAGLRSFENTLACSPSRFTRIGGYPFDVVLDFASGPEAAMSVAEAIARLPAAGRRFCMFSLPGNRDEATFAEMGAALAGRFDRYVAYELADYRRRREPGEIARRLRDSLAAHGVRAGDIAVATDAEGGFRTLATWARPGDLIVVLFADVPSLLPAFREAFRAHGEPIVA